MEIGGSNMLYTLHYDNNYSESIRVNIDAENGIEAKKSQNILDGM